METNVLLVKKNHLYGEHGSGEVSYRVLIWEEKERKESGKTKGTWTGGSTTGREVKEQLNIEFQRHKQECSEREGSASYL